MIRRGNDGSPRVLAFLQRALEIHPRRRPFEDLSQRSLRALSRLDSPCASMRFRIALDQLRFDWDLLSEQAALNPDALRLQLRVLDLADDHAEAERLIRPHLNDAPLSRLFMAILAQGVRDAAREIVFDFGSSAEDEVRILFRRAEGEHEAMVVPPTLNEPLRGFVRFVEAAGFPRIRRRFRHSEGFPDRLESKWETANRLAMNLHSTASPSQASVHPESEA